MSEFSREKRATVYRGKDVVAETSYQELSNPKNAEPDTKQRKSKPQEAHSRIRSIREIDNRDKKKQEAVRLVATTTPDAKGNDAQDLAREIEALEKVIAEDKKEEQERIDAVIAEIDAQNTGAPQYGKTKNKEMRESLRAMQKEMDENAKIMPEPEPQEPVVGDEALPEAEEDDEELAETPLETRNRLKELVARAEEKARKTSEALTKTYARATEYFDKTVISLDEKFENLKMNAPNLSFKDVWGGTVKIGEEYRKAGLAYKLALAGALLGTGAFVGVAGASGAGIIAAGIATQRALSSLGTYALVDALMERRLAKKGTYTKTERYVKHGTAIGAGGAMLLGVPGALFAEGLEKTEWLAQMLGATKTEEVVASMEIPTEAVSIEPESTAPTVEVETLDPSAISTPEEVLSSAVEPEAVAEETVSTPVAPEAVAATPEVPEITVEAKAGKGYEWMLKRLWEELQDKGLSATDYPEGSDIRTLLEADEKSINGAVHNLATANGAFIEADGTSKLVRLDDVISLGSDGNIDLNGEEVSSRLTDRGVTPPYLPQVELTDVPESIPVSEPEPEVLLSEDPLDAMSSLEENTLIESGLSGESSLAPQEAPQIFTTIDNTIINPAVPAIYEVQGSAGEKYLYAYGGTDEERFAFIQKFLSEEANKGKTIRFEHEVKSIFGSKSEVSSYGENGVASVKLGFFRGAATAPALDTFLTKISK